MNTLREPSERTEAVRRLLVEAVERPPQGRVDGSRSTATRFRWVTAATAGAATVTVASLLAVGLATGPLASGGSGNGGRVGSGGEGSSTSMGSRVKLYRSLDELVRDSSAVLTGTVVAEQPLTDDSGYSRWVLRVGKAYSPKGLGDGVGGAAPMPEAGTDVSVRHFAGGGVVTSVGQPLAVGQRYLLFLSPTGIPGASANQFFITGAGAGTYLAEGDEYRRARADGDTLPATLTAGDLSG